MPFRLQIPRAIYKAMIAQARAEFPNECVGMLAGVIEGEVARVVERYPLVNVLADSRRFESDSRSMFEAEKRRRDKGLEFLAVYHSHPNSPPIPSKTDLEMNYSEDVMNLIISLTPPAAEVKAYWLTATAYRLADWAAT